MRNALNLESSLVRLNRFQLCVRTSCGIGACVGSIKMAGEPARTETRLHHVEKYLFWCQSTSQELTSFGSICMMSSRESPPQWREFQNQDPIRKHQSNLNQPIADFSVLPQTHHTKITSRSKQTSVQILEPRPLHSSHIKPSCAHQRRLYTLQVRLQRP